MYLLIDNYDSFVYNLVAYIQELGRKVKVIRNDAVDIKMLDKIIEEETIKGIIISPGPKSPKESKISREVIKHYFNSIPILGVCLGHEVIAYHFGAIVDKGKYPMHGKVNLIYHNGKGIFNQLTSPYKVTRYHSLEVKVQNLPDCLQIDAVSEDGVIMAISHKQYPLYGVQFHPEAVLTQQGHALLENFINLCDK